MDLLVVGEWMPIRFFRNINGQLRDVTATTGLANTSGWWNSVVGDDFDRDGDVDYVAGNLGLNSPYQPLPGRPVQVYAADFDGSGTIDPILINNVEGQPVAVASRDALAFQMPAARRRFPRYAHFAQATADQVLTPDERRGAFKASCELLQSSYLENKGGGKFAVRPLPVGAQVAPVFGLLAGDYNADGNSDILLSGNSYASEFIVGWYDAGDGLLLLGDGKGGFAPVTTRNSGFRADGDCKGMTRLRLKDGKELVLVGRNKAVLKAFFVTKRVGKRMVAPSSLEAWGEYTNGDGRKVRKEFYYGDGYLGQSSRQWMLPQDVTLVRIYDYSGRPHQVPVQQLEPQ